MKPQRILLLVHGGDVPWGTDQQSYGGYVRFFEAAVAELNDAGHEVIFGSLRARTPIHPVIENMGLETFALGCRTSRDYPLAAIRLARIVRRSAPTILHLNESPQAAIGGVAGAMSRGPVRIFHRHHTYAKGSWAAFSRIASRLTHLTMAVSQSVADAAHDQDRVPRSRIRVAYNGIDLRNPSDQNLAQLRKDLNISDDSLVVANVGHMRSEKGQADLLDALPEVATALDPPLHLIFVGDGPEERSLRERARSLMHVTVHFAGHQDDVAQWYALADVVAVTSHAESFGLPVIEAMAASRPVVATRVEGPAEIVIDHTTGLLVPRRDRQALSRALLTILGDRDRAEEMGRAGRARYESFFTVKAMVASWIDCYEAAIASSSARSKR